MPRIKMREIALVREGHRVLVDFDGEHVRVAYYYPKTKKKNVRVAFSHPSLEHALGRIRADVGKACGFDPDTLAWYIRATDWGSVLP